MADSSTGDQTSPVQPSGNASRLDDRIAAVADERRRQALARAAGADGELALADLAESLVDDGAGATPLASDPDHVALRLHHVHLPKLADAGLVEYDPAARRVALTDAGERFCTVLDEL